MSDQHQTPESETETTARREFLSQMGKVAVTAPAVALLVTASARPAAATYRVERQDFRERPGS